MPNHTSLASLFGDIADAIRAKTGGSAQIVADDFPNEIAAIPTSGKNIQAYRGYDTVAVTSYQATDVTLTVEKTGTYNISWMGFRTRTSGTFGSQLYKNGVAVGTANTSFIGSGSNTYGHSVSLQNQSLTEGDVLVVWARSGYSGSYIMGVGNLIIEEV